MYLSPSGLETQAIMERYWVRQAWLWASCDFVRDSRQSMITVALHRQHGYSRETYTWGIYAVCGLFDGSICG